MYPIFKIDYVYIIKINPKFEICVTISKLKVNKILINENNN